MEVGPTETRGFAGGMETTGGFDSEGKRSNGRRLRATQGRRSGLGRWKGAFAERIQDGEERWQVVRVSLGLVSGPGGGNLGRPARISREFSLIT